MEYMFINISNACAMQKDHYENSIMYLHVEIMLLIRGMKASVFFFNLFCEEKSNKIQWRNTMWSWQWGRRITESLLHFCFHSPTELNYTLLDLCPTRFSDQRFCCLLQVNPLGKSEHFSNNLDPLICEPQTTFSVPK